MISDVPGKFEIVVKREKNSFKATCSMFPEVTGEGKNEEKAIESLADGLANKMGTMIRTVLDDVLKNDLLKLLKAEAKVTDALKSKVNKIAETRTPAKRPFMSFARQKSDKNKEKKFIFQMPSLETLTQGKNIDLRKVYPAMRGLLMVLGLHTVQKNPEWYGSMEYLDSNRLEELEEKFFYALMDSGVFDSPQCTGCRTPFGIMLGIPVSFN